MRKMSGARSTTSVRPSRVAASQVTATSYPLWKETERMRGRAWPTVTTSVALIEASPSPFEHLAVLARPGQRRRQVATVELPLEHLEVGHPTMTSNPGPFTWKCGGASSSADMRIFRACVSWWMVGKAQRSSPA